MKYFISLIFILILLSLPGIPEATVSGQQLPLAVRLQILLDRAGFSTGEIDGRIGSNVEKALIMFQETANLEVTGRPNDETLFALGDSDSDNLLISYTITSHHSETKIAAGPNNPVGLVWIGVNAPHYGLHGTPEPGAIGHSESHGCIRMTNWDALRLSKLIGNGTRVIFQ